MRANAVAVVLLVGLVGCTRTSGPVEVPPDELPAPIRGSAGAAPSATDVDVTVYFVQGDRLVASTRAVQGTSDVDAAIRGLLRGPTGSEAKTGIFTAIPQDVELLEVRVAGTVAEVDLSHEFEAPTSRQRIVLRLAQVVWTLTSLPDLSAVRFLVDGEPAAVLTDAGMAVDRPVAAADYDAVSPRQMR